MPEFQWWLLLVGLVFGAGLVWLVLSESARREADIEAVELPAEAVWIAERLGAGGRGVDVGTALAVLVEHRRYRDLPPPELPDADAEPAEPPEAASAAGSEASAEPPGSAEAPASTESGAPVEPPASAEAHLPGESAEGRG
jgi:hypothetical protein